jgi:hypothetical protein
MKNLMNKTTYYYNLGILDFWSRTWKLDIGLWILNFVTSMKEKSPRILTNGGLRKKKKTIN